MEDSLCQDVWPQSPGGSSFLASSLPLLSLPCVCLCFPSMEPGIFPLSIFSPGTLDHPGVQSWTEVSGAVWCTPGFALRSVSSWRWFLKMACSAFWGWPPFQVAWLASPCLCASPHLPLHTCLPHPFLSASPQCFLLPCHPLLFSSDWRALFLCHCALWTSVSLGQESANFYFLWRSRQKIL